MTRHFTLAAILALLTTSLSAQEPRVPFTDLEDPAPASPLTPGTKDADLAGPLAASFDFNVDGDVTSRDETLPPSGTTTLDSASRGFHPVCDCGCHIPPLDHWCDCCEPCCTTDCWVEYPCSCSQGNCYLTEDGSWVSNDTWCDVWGTDVYRSTSAVRFGWWSVGTDGSPQKIGEYQALDSSPFWDVEAISSDGVRTWDMSLAGLDSEANDARVRYYGPNVAARINYQRYLRRWDHDPLIGYDLGSGVPPAPNDNVVSEDLNVGQDYAIRVQELDARFKGRLTDNLKWRLNLWGQRKFGERQANAVAHCFNINDPAAAGADGNTCHLLSQEQTIDWLTMEIQPVVEAEFDQLTVEYSRTMRSFNQDDGRATRTYSRFNFNLPSANGFVGPDYDYAIVPENLTQIDRLKVGATLTENNRFYGNLFHGDTKNEFRDTHREFDGFDLRLTNTTFDSFDLTAYASRYDENNELPSFFFTAPPLAPANTYDQDSLRHPVDYTRTRAGLKGSWRPYAGAGAYGYGWRCGTSLVSGYEYYQLERDFATYNTTPVPPGPFSQPDTITHQLEFGPSTRWSRSLETFTRYKARFIDVPLIGVSEYSEDELDVLATFNSSLPEQVHAVEIGGTWTPTDNFMTTVQFSIENSWHDSQYANFTENNYPLIATAWYAPTYRWSFTGAYAYFSNWIDQDISLGANRGDATETERTEWAYAGENHLVSLNANYAWTECVQLVGGYEWNRGTNTFRVPTSPHAADGVDWSLLPFLSDVVAETQRLTAGVDWQPDHYMNFYFRYVLFDYDDVSSGLDSGTSHMILAGGGVNW